MFQLADGRQNVYQWDINVKLLLDEGNESADEVHFSARFSRVSLSVEVIHTEDSSYVTIPNILLQKPNDIIAYSYITNADGSYTKYDTIIPVIARPKPSGYIYEETEILTWKTLDDKIDDLGRSTADAVKYTEQELTAEQKSQARTNIGAVSVGEVPEQVQADHSQNDRTQPDFIKNRTHYQSTLIDSGYPVDFMDGTHSVGDIVLLKAVSKKILERYYISGINAPYTATHALYLKFKVTYSGGTYTIDQECKDTVASNGSPIVEINEISAGNIKALYYNLQQPYIALYCISDLTTLTDDVKAHFPKTGIYAQVVNDLQNASSIQIGCYIKQYVKLDSKYLNIPTATSDAPGVVKPVSKTDEMTQPVGVDRNGELFATEQLQTDWDQKDDTAADYLKNRPFGEGFPEDLGTYNFTATSETTITYVIVDDGSWDVLRHLYNHQGVSNATQVVIDGKTDLWTSSFDRGRLSANGNKFHLTAYYNFGETVSITHSPGIFTTGNTYPVLFQDVSDDSIKKIDLRYIPKSVYTSENAPVKFGDGYISTVQGVGTTASGDHSHAEGSYTTAFGEDSHAEGGHAVASGNFSHAEGFGTVASGISSHAEGEYNVEDSASVYAHIVGNGTNDNNRSNAHALDWDGNAYYKGTVYVNGTNADASGGREVATKSGWTPDKFIGTDENGNLVEKDAPAGGGSVPMTGATADTDGAAGLVPAPKSGEQNKFLKGDGTWAEADKTLSKDGYAADAKVVGEKISELSGKIENLPSGGAEDKSKLTAYDAGAVRPFLRYDTLYDEINPLFVTKYLNTKAADNAVEIINDGATVHEVSGVVSPDNRYVYIAYLKNIDGTTADTGDTSESGRCKVYLKAAYNDYGACNFKPVISSDEVELFAKGQALIDGSTIDTGGPSAPMLYTNDTTLFAVCIFEGKGYGGYVRTADISASPALDALAWSEAKPWTLSIDGEVGAFNMNRLNGWTDATWQTNNQITYRNNLFYQAICVNGKAVVLVKSSDGINWEYTNTIYTDYLCKFQCEAAIFRHKNGKIWIAVRNGNTSSSVSKLACGNKNYLTVFKVSSTGKKIEEYNIPDTGVKPYFVPVPLATDQGAYLLHNAQSRYSIQIEYIDEFYPGMTLGEMYGVGTNYCTCAYITRRTSAQNVALMLMGTNGLVTEQLGASLVYGIWLGQYLDGSVSLGLVRKLITSSIDNEVTADSTNLITSGAVAKAISEYKYEYNLPVASPTTLGGVMPVAKTSAMSQEVGVDDNGKLWVPGVSVSKWSLLETVTVESGATSVTINFDTVPSKVILSGIIKADADASLNVVGNYTNWGYANNRIVSIPKGINTNLSKRFVLKMEKIASKMWLCEFSYNIEGYATGTQYTRALETSAIDDLNYITLLSATDGQEFTGGTIKVYTQ